MLLNKDSIEALSWLLHDYKIKDICGSYKTFFDKDEIGCIFTVDENVAQKSNINTQTSIQTVPQNQPMQARQTITAKLPPKETTTNNADFTNKDINILSHQMNIVEGLKQDANKLTTVTEIKKYLSDSSFCSLKKLAQNTVLCDGAESAKVMLIGEAPGEDEDKNGIPFCGRSGRLLDNVLLSIGLNRKDNLYITNTIFWRPPANRKPTVEEIAQCRPFVLRQIELLKPSLIILCGSTALECITQKEDVKIGDSRGNILKVNLNGVEYNATSIYHPSYLLRNPSAKKLAWMDMMFIKSLIKDYI